MRTEWTLHFTNRQSLYKPKFKVAVLGLKSLTNFQTSISTDCASTLYKFAVYFKTWLCCAPVLQSRWSWTAEEGAPPVTKDIPDVARTLQVKWPECSCHVKYVSGLSKQWIQYSEGRKPCGVLIFLGLAIHWKQNPIPPSPNLFSMSGEISLESHVY